MKAQIVVEAPAINPVEQLSFLAFGNYRTLKEKRSELKTAREMFKDNFVKDQLWSKAKEVEDKAREKLKVEKTRVMQQPGVFKMSEKIKQIQDEITEKKQAMSDYALEYNRQTGKTEIEVKGEDKKLTIVKTATLEEL